MSARRRPKPWKGSRRKRSRERAGRNDKAIATQTRTRPLVKKNPKREPRIKQMNANKPIHSYLRLSASICGSSLSLRALTNPRQTLAKPVPHVLLLPFLEPSACCRAATAGRGPCRRSRSSSRRRAAAPRRSSRNQAAKRPSSSRPIVSLPGDCPALAAPIAGASMSASLSTKRKATRSFLWPKSFATPKIRVLTDAAAQHRP